MRDIIDILIQVLTKDIFIGYGLFTLLFILITTFKNDIKVLNKLDLYSNQLIIFSGIVYLISIVVIISISLFDRQSDQGRFILLQWIQPFIWVLTTQLLWIKWIREKKLMRLIISVLLIISFEKYVIILTSLYGDRMTSLLNGETAFQLFVGLTIKTIVFCVLAILFSFVAKRLGILRVK